MVIDFGRDVCGAVAAANAREWLVTNGIGGYASGTVDGSLARSYHGYLVAALRPPGARTLMLAKCDESCTYLGETYALATNRWHSGAIDPTGYRLLERFFLDGTTPVWRFACADALVEKRITLRPGANVALVRYAVLRAQAPLAFVVRAIVDHRDHNETRTGDRPPPAIAERDDAVVVTFPGAEASLYLRSDRCVPAGAMAWYRDYDLIRERERGLPDRDDHVHAATFSFALNAGEVAHVWAGTPDVRFADPGAPWRERSAHEADLLSKVRVRSPEHAQLLLAADQFIVARASERNPTGKTVIAGYPWFTDWGRDTAISLPGLTLATGRPEIARAILETFAHYVDGDMLPNVFPDRGETPQYNTVDAALWYVEAARAYVEFAGIDAAFETLYAACAAIVTGYRNGTRYGIHMAEDALIAAGEPGVQLTWMDAKYGDTIVTPRAGKPMEINALWYNALCTMADFTRRRGASATEYDALARRVRESFARFVLPERRGLADVLDGPGGDDATLRPNQIFAVSLAHSPLDAAIARAVVDVCARDLVTSHGLRTLAPGDAQYIGHYSGTREERDGAYHQGTVWPWLLGPFCCAYAAAYGDEATARTFLEPLLQSLCAAGLGTIGEVADGNAPFAWGGAIAQAWSVAELLRALERCATPQ